MLVDNCLTPRQGSHSRHPPPFLHNHSQGTPAHTDHCWPQFPGCDPMFILIPTSTANPALILILTLTLNLAALQLATDISKTCACAKLRRRFSAAAALWTVHEWLGCQWLLTALSSQPVGNVQSQIRMLMSKRFSYQAL